MDVLQEVFTVTPVSSTGQALALSHQGRGGLPFYIDGQDGQDFLVWGISPSPPYQVRGRLWPSPIKGEGTLQSLVDQMLGPVGFRGGTAVSITAAARL